MAKPVKITAEGNIQEFTDADLERLVYELQVAFVEDFLTNGIGQPGAIVISPGGSGGRVLLHSQQNTRSTQTQTNVNAPSNDGTNTSFPAYPQIGEENVNNYNYSQVLDTSYAPSFPSATALQNSYLRLSGTDLQLEGTTLGMTAEIIDEAFNQMINGNEVGTWRVDSTTPTAGGAGEWRYDGLWFLDQRYNDVGETTYSRYIKRNLTTPPGTEVLPAGFDFGEEAISQKSMSGGANAGTMSDLMSDVLLPVLHREIILNNKLRYAITANASETGKVERGFWADTKFTQRTTANVSTGSGMSQVYRARSTPNTSGATTEIARFYLHLA